MTELTDVVNSLFRARRERRPVAGTIERISDGVLHVDYDDPDHVYLVTVRQVPRIQLELERPVVVGHIGEVPVRLVQVRCANHVEVVFDAERGHAYESALEDFSARYHRWDENMKVDRSVRPPPWPGEQVMEIAVTVSDDLGTAYLRASAVAGGMGAPFRCEMKFLPAPPSSAHQLTLDLTPPDGTPVRVPLPLPDRASSPADQR